MAGGEVRPINCACGSPMHKSAHARCTPGSDWTYHPHRRRPVRSRPGALRLRPDPRLVLGALFRHREQYGPLECLPQPLRHSVLPGHPRGLPSHRSVGVQYLVPLLQRCLPIAGRGPVGDRPERACLLPDLLCALQGLLAAAVLRRNQHRLPLGPSTKLAAISHPCFPAAFPAPWRAERARAEAARSRRASTAIVTG